MRRLLCTLLLTLILMSCVNTRIQQNNVINLQSAITLPVNQMVLSDAADDIEFIPLETRSECMLGNAYYVLSCPEGFLITDMEHVYLFGKEGMFVQEIGSYGQGPQEHQLVSCLGYDPDSKEVFVKTEHQKVIVYGIDGSYHNTIKLFDKDIFLYGSGTRESREYRYVDGFHITRHKFPMQGFNEKPWQVRIKDSKNKLVAEIVDPATIGCEELLLEKMNYSELDKQGLNWASFAPVLGVYRGERSLLFDANDTIYSFLMDRIEPRYVMKTGSESFSVEELHKQDRSDHYFNNYINPVDFLDSKDNLYVLAENGANAYLCRFDKRTGEVCSIHSEGELKFQKLMNTHYRYVEHTPCFTDDLAGICPFFPKHANDNEWIGVIYAHRLLSEINIAELEQRDTKLPHRKQQLINILKSLKEDDNPILCIARLK